VILVSDASVFINEMLERPDNQQLARNLLTTSETVLLDYQHRDGIPTAVALVHTAADAPILQWMIVAVLTVGVGIAWSKTPITQIDRTSSRLLTKHIATATTTMSWRRSPRGIPSGTLNASNVSQEVLQGMAQNSRR